MPEALVIERFCGAGGYLVAFVEFVILKGPSHAHHIGTQVAQHRWYVDGSVALPSRFLHLGV